MTDRIIEVPRDANPFPRAGTTALPGGGARYDALPATLIDLLRSRARETPDAEAVAEIGGGRERLADYKVPQYVTVTGEQLPRNAGGKLLKARLRESVAWGPPLRR